MHITKYRGVVSLIAALVLAALAFGATLATAPSARADASPRRICTADANDWCMNRYHGQTSSGTPVISYTDNTNDPNEDFEFLVITNFVCGQYGTVHNGENGCWGPFTVGSGLNQRYDGKNVGEIVSYFTNWCSVIDQHLATDSLQNCGSVGYVFVDSPVNGADYLVNVAYSNSIYQATQVTNRPYWLDANSFGQSLIVDPAALTSWKCKGPDC